MMRFAAAVVALSTAHSAPALRGIRMPKAQVASGLPPLRYRFSSFATASPQEAADFTVKYFGAVLLPTQEYLTHRAIASNATVRGVRFHYTGNVVTAGAKLGPKPVAQGSSTKAAFHDVYFVDDPTKPTGPMSPKQYEEYLHGIHRFDVEETWDWYQDWHLCFDVDDIDLVAYRLVQDGIPIVTRSSYSFYVEIPFGITFQFLGSKLTVVWSELFNFCRITDDKSGTKAQQKRFEIASIPSPLPAIPALAPAHHSYFSNQPDVAFNFTLKHVGGTPFDMNRVWQESHRYSDGRCALLRWIDYPGFQVHFVDQYRKYQGNFTTAKMEQYLEKLHGPMQKKDAYFDFKLGFEVDDLLPFQQSLDAEPAGSAQYLRQSEAGTDVLYIKIPGGIIFELFQSKGAKSTGPVVVAKRNTLRWD